MLCTGVCSIFVWRMSPNQQSLGLAWELGLEKTDFHTFGGFRTRRPLADIQARKKSCLNCEVIFFSYADPDEAAGGTNYVAFLKRLSSLEPFLDHLGQGFLKPGPHRLQSNRVFWPTSALEGQRARLDCGPWGLGFHTPDLGQLSQHYF